MKSSLFYAGHSFEWMDKFLIAIPKGCKLSRSTAVGIAMCIHHLYVYKKQSIIKLSHKTLSFFGIERRCLKPYLTLFEQAGLIKYVVKKGSSPIITLLAVPTNYTILNNNKINKYTAQVHNLAHPPMQSCTGNMYNLAHVENTNKKQGKHGSKGAEEVRQVGKRGNQGLKGGDVKPIKFLELNK